MKKFILVFIASTFVALSSWAVSTSPVNCYATRLSLPNNGVVDESRQTSFKFYVVAETDEWWIYIDKNSDGDFSDDEQIYHSTDNIEVNKRDGRHLEFVIKTDNQNSTKVANSMHELIEIKESLVTQTTFLEEFLEGDVTFLTSLWDGKNLVAFDKELNLTEVVVLSDESFVDSFAVHFSAI